MWSGLILGTLILTFIFAAVIRWISYRATAVKAHHVVFRCTSATIQARIDPTRICQNQNLISQTH